MATQAQVLANRRNAARSTGPRTMQGKAVVAQNAIKHGLLARQNVVMSEDPQEFDLHRGRLLGELEPVGMMETILVERIVSLTWRLRRAERLQNEVFDSLLAEELHRSMDHFDDELSPEDEQDLKSDPASDPGFAVGRMAARDYSNDRVLDRLQMYEQRIEGSLFKTTKELRGLQLGRKADTGHSLACKSDSAKQSQSAKDVPCETKPMDAEVSSGEPALQTSPLTPEASRQTPDGVTTNGTGTREAEDPMCETKPISGGQDSEISAGGDVLSDCAKQSQLRPGDQLMPRADI